MKNKSIDRVSKNFAIFFEMQEKQETCQDSNLSNFRRPSFGDM